MPIPTPHYTTKSTEKKNKKEEDLRLMLGWKNHPKAWVTSMFGLTHQPVKSEHEQDLRDCINSQSWLSVKAEWFDHFVKGKHYTWQQWMMLEAVGAAVREEGARRITIASGHGVGKAHCSTNVVPCQDGIIQWGKVKKGTNLINEHGQSVVVTSTKHYKSIPFYNVLFDDGSSCDVSSGHLWNVRGRQERRKKLDTWRTMETIQILQEGVLRSNGAAMARQWEIPIQEAVQWPERKTDLPHYFMGIWLAEGHKNYIATTQPRIIQYLEENFITKIIGNYVSITGIYNKTLERKNMRSSTKYIPEKYKYGSIQQRKDLLAGLLDGDGECQKNHTVLYSSTSWQLIDDVTDLARSLGYKVHTPTSKVGKYTKDGKTHICQTCYRITITAHENPFKLSIHKRERWRKPEDRYLKRWITSIEPIGDKDGMCVTVDSPTGLYLANDYIVTHNSCTCAWLMLWFLMCHQNCRVGATAPSSDQLHDVLWTEAKKWIDKMPEQFQMFYEWTGSYIRATQDPKNWWARARTARVDNPEALQGLHAKDTLIIVDESSGVLDPIFNAAEATLTDENPLMVMISNPTRLYGYFYNSHHEDKEAWQRLVFSGLDSPVVDHKYVNRIAEKHGTDSDEYRIRIEGRFPKTDSMDSDGYVSLIAVDKVYKTTDHTLNVGKKRLGVDVAGSGDDTSVWVIRDQGKAKIVHEEKTSNDLSVVRKTITLMEQYQVEAQDTYIDMFGEGAKAAQKLAQLGHFVNAVNVGDFLDKRVEGEDDKKRFRNKRAHAYWRLREWLIKGGELVVNPVWDEQLASIRYRRNISSAIEIMSKQKMRKLAMKSPDHLDALMITFTDPDYSLEDEELDEEYDFDGDDLYSGAFG